MQLVKRPCGRAGESRHCLLNICHQAALIMGLTRPSTAQGTPIEMTQPELSHAERANLRVFRQVAAEARVALGAARNQDRSMRIVNGYIESEGSLDRVRDMCIPVRRAYLKNDPVNMGRILEFVSARASDEIKALATGFQARYAPIQNELDSASILNDRRVTHAEMFEAWIDAMVFHDDPVKRQPFLAMADELGKAVEGIALHLAERIAERLLELDDLVAEFLGEPKSSVGDAENDSA